MCLLHEIFFFTKPLFCYFFHTFSLLKHKRSIFFLFFILLIVKDSLLKEKEWGYLMPYIFSSCISVQYCPNEKPWTVDYGRYCCSSAIRSKECPLPNGILTRSDPPQCCKGYPFDFHTQGPFLFHIVSFHTKIIIPFISIQWSFLFPYCFGANPSTVCPKMSWNPLGILSMCNICYIHLIILYKMQSCLGKQGKKKF